MDKATPEWWVLPVTPTGGPRPGLLPATSSVPMSPTWGSEVRSGGGGQGRDRPRGENREGKEPEAAPHCAFLWGPSCSQTGADPRAGVGVSTCA